MQLRVTPLGDVELLSTHDQLLGGPSGQSYLGCRFPADFGYAREITARRRRSASASRGEGVLGRFAVDFVVVRDRGGTWTPYAIELNLRKGGTTHPVPDAAVPHRRRATTRSRRCSPRRAAARSTSSRPTTSSPTLLRGLTIDDLFDIAVRHRLHFDQARQTGDDLPHDERPDELGRVGLTAVGDTPEQADVIFRRAERVLVEEAGPPPEAALPPV